MVTSNFVGKGWPCNSPNGEEYMREEVLVEGFESRPIGTIAIKMTAEKIEFSSDNGFGRLLTNPRLTDNGQTVGERNRAELHERLDEWLNGNFMEKNV